MHSQPEHTPDTLLTGKEPPAYTGQGAGQAPKWVQPLERREGSLAYAGSQILTPHCVQLIAKLLCILKFPNSKEHKIVRFWVLMAVTGMCSHETWQTVINVLAEPTVLMMEAVSSSKMLVIVYQPRQHDIPEDSYYQDINYHGLVLIHLKTWDISAFSLKCTK